MIKLIGDSTCNLPDEIVARYDIRIAPVAIQFGNESYEENINIDRATFYAKVEEMGIIPTTSQPTPAWFERHYRELTAAGHSVLAITITSEHSGTYNSAIMAKSLVPEANVEVFDSRGISMTTGYQILEAARMIENGATMESVLARLAEIRDRSYFYFTPATLKYLQMSGRVSTLKGAIGALLSVKPVVSLSDGRLEAGESIRTRGKALDRIFTLLKENVGTSEPANLAVIHAAAPEEAQALEERVRSEFNVNELFNLEIPASLAVHGGPGIIAVVGYRF